MKPFYGKLNPINFKPFPENYHQCLEIKFINLSPIEESLKDLTTTKKMGMPCCPLRQALLLNRLQCPAVIFVLTFDVNLKIAGRSGPVRLPAGLDPFFSHKKTCPKKGMKHLHSRNVHANDLTCFGAAFNYFHVCLWCWGRNIGNSIKTRGITAMEVDIWG